MSDFYKEYHKKHSACPKCGGTHIATTLMGPILTIGKEDEYKDTNECVCSNCFFHCIRHELVEIK